MKQVDTKEKFYFIKKKYGKHASWAVWPEQGELPKSNMGNMSVLELQKFLIMFII